MKQKTDTKKNQADVDVVAINTQLTQDVKTSILIVSMVINLVILTAWIALQVTSAYDAQMASLLFG